MPELGGILVTGGEEWFCNGREKHIKSTSPSTAELLIIAKSQSIPMGELPVLVADHSICYIGQNRVVISGTMIIGSALLAVLAKLIQLTQKSQDNFNFGPSLLKF